MKLWRAVLAVALCSSPVHAELAKLGDFALGASQAKPSSVKGKLYGCDGTFTQKIEGGKIAAVEFAADAKCDLAKVSDQIDKDYAGVTSLRNVEKAGYLWEGKTTSVYLERTANLSVHLIKPGAGAKRACFTEDGFAEFFQKFGDNLDKADVAAASFQYPVKNFEGKVTIKDAKAMVKKWPTLISKDDRSGIKSRSNRPVCSFSSSSYELRLGDSNISLEAKKLAGKWLWVQINEEAPG